jgi:type I restriction enzyme S subunit
MYPVYGASGLVAKVNFYQQDKDYLAIIKDGAGVGRVYHYEPKTSVLGTLQYLYPKPNTNIRFAYYYLRSVDFAKYYQGAAIPHIYFRDYKTEKLILPPLPEQERIVGILDKAFDEIDQVKANAEQKLTHAKELFDNTLDAQITTLYKNSSTQKLSEVCDVRDGTHDSPKYLDKGGHPFVTSKNLKNDKIDMEKITYISDFDFEKINERSKVDIGDVLFAMIGTIGNPVVIIEEPNFAIKNVALFKNINKLDPQYLKFLLKSPSVLLKMQLEANGTTQKFVSLKYLRNFMVPVPSISEQQKIVEKIDSLQEQIRKLEQIYTQKIKECDELKQSILQKAFRGEL